MEVSLGVVQVLYGYPERSRRQESWNLLRHLSRLSPLPWCVLGDFNDLLHIEDKRGRVDHPDWLFRGFREAVSDCFLQDLPMEVYLFTWERGRGTANCVEERLDRALVTSDWLALFPLVRLRNLVSSVSDHSPLELITCPSTQGEEVP